MSNRMPPYLGLSSQPSLLDLNFHFFKEKSIRTNIAHVSEHHLNKKYYCGKSESIFEQKN